MVEIDRGVLTDRPTTAPRPAERALTELEVGSTGEAVAGAAAVILGILGLIGVLPIRLDAVAAIVLGAALLIGGGAVAGRYAGLLPAGRAARARREVGGALGLQALAGVAAIVLGVLALLGVSPLGLLAVAAIVLGAALLASGGAMARLERSMQGLRGETVAGPSGTAVYAAGGWEGIIGAGLVVLGILALAGHSPLTLTLVAMLSAGAALLVGGSTLAARLLGFAG